MQAGRRILVVDDEASVRDLITRTLASHGFACHTAANGRLALARLEQQPHAIVLCDIRMPEMDGLTEVADIFLAVFAAPQAAALAPR